MHPDIAKVYIPNVTNWREKTARVVRKASVYTTAHPLKHKKIKFKKVFVHCAVASNNNKIYHHNISQTSRKQIICCAVVYMRENRILEKKVDVTHVSEAAIDICHQGQFVSVGGVKNISSRAKVTLCKKN